MSNQTTISAPFSPRIGHQTDKSERLFQRVKDRLVSEFDGKPFRRPVFDDSRNTTHRAQEDWTPGCRLFCAAFKTKIGRKSRTDYHQPRTSPKTPKESGREDAPEKEWRNRHKGIAEAEVKICEMDAGRFDESGQRNVKSYFRQYKQLR